MLGMASSPKKGVSGGDRGGPDLVGSAAPELLYIKFTRKEQTLIFAGLLNGNYDFRILLRFS